MTSYRKIIWLFICIVPYSIAKWHTNLDRISPKFFFVIFYFSFLFPQKSASVVLRMFNTFSKKTRFLFYTNKITTKKIYIYIYYKHSEREESKTGNSLNPFVLQKYLRMPMIYIILKIKNTDGLVFITLLLLYYVYIGLDNTVTFARSHYTDNSILFLFYDIENHNC